jgi:hypothetical protein
LTQPGATGNQTYSLASGFNPCAVLLWAVPLAADGTAASWAYGLGFGTYRGSVVQQRFVTMRGLDAAASADTARGAGNDAVLVIQTQSAGVATRDCVITLVSMATGASSNVILNWTNLHTTASIRVFMLAFGGSDITDALADHFSYPTASTTWDENVGVSSIAYVGAGTAASAASGNVTPTLPSGSTGDFQLLHVAAADNVTVTVSGWTSVIATNQSTKLRQSIFSRVRAGGDGNPTVTHTGGSTIRARIFAWSGASAVDTSGATGAAASVTVTAPTVTPASAGSALVWFGCEENTGDTSGTPTWAGYSDAGLAEIDDGREGTFTDMVSSAAAWRVKKDTVATGTVTGTVTGENGTPDNNLGAHVVLTPTTFSAVGQPDLVFFAGNGPLTEVATSPKFFFGWARKGQAGRAVAFSQLDGNTASLVAMRQRSDRCILSIVATAGGGTDEALGQLDTTTANWPTNGFRAVFDANPASADACLYLALKGTFQSADGNNTAVIAGSPPVTQDNAAGFAPKLGLVFGWNLAAATTMDTASADLGAVGIGAYDGTDQAWAGLTEDDAALTMDSNQQQETDHILANYNQAASLQSSATGVFSGNNFRLSWDDIDSVARQYQWLALGDAAAAGATAPPPYRRPTVTWQRTRRF